MYVCVYTCTYVSMWVDEYVYIYTRMCVHSIPNTKKCVATFPLAFPSNVGWPKAVSP